SKLLHLEMVEDRLEVILELLDLLGILVMNSIQIKTQTWSSRMSTANRCTPCPRIVEHRPSLRWNRQRCKGQTTSPSSIQPWPSEPPACGQRSDRAIIVSPYRKTARRRPRT